MKELSDFELNKAITEKLIWMMSGTKSVEYEEKQKCFWRESIGHCSFEIKDYCNNWSDLMPLVVEYKIEHEYWNNTDEWTATDYTYCSGPTETLQRAYTECLLKVLQGEQANEL